MPDSPALMDEAAMQSAFEEIQAMKKTVIDLGRSINVDLSNLSESASVAEPASKKRGAPRGNTNALKHGYYSKVLSEKGPDGVSRSVVMDFRGEIVVIKDLIFRLYKQGFSSKSAEETASCLRAISWASLALCRLVQTQDEFTPLKPVNPLVAMRNRAVISRVEGTVERLEGGIDRLLTQIR